MNVLQLLRVGPFEPVLARELARGLEAEFQAPCALLPRIAGPEFAFHPERQPGAEAAFRGLCRS